MNEAETRAELIDPSLTADYGIIYRNTQLAGPTAVSFSDKLFYWVF